MSSDVYDYKLTAIVLVYNGEPYLDACLNSLVSQTMEGLEILLINDASTDNSLDVCRKYEREYDNVFVIDKEKNEGLATSANMGIDLARGEYVILVDNDDIIPKDAYEKLYLMANKTDSDISIGKANFLTSTSQYEMHYLETNVWSRERTIGNVNEFPEIFHDAFYWNKIIRKDLLMAHDIRLPTGKIYADRNFSHKAYVHANKISIIPDCVYLWRIRQDSLSMKKQNLDNYVNRIDSYEMGLEEITDCYSDYFKILLRRVIIPIRGMLDDDDFEEFLFTRVRDLISAQKKIMTDIYDNDLTNEFNICLYLILNGEREKLKRFLKTDLNCESDVFDEDARSYWKLPQFRNPEYALPDELFEIKYLESQFFKIAEIRAGEDSIIFDGITIPEHYPMEVGQVIFKGRTGENEVYEDNWLTFEIKKDDDYRLEIPLDDLKTFTVYDVFFKSVNQHRISNEFRIVKANIGNIKNNARNLAIDYSAGNHLRVKKSSAMSGAASILNRTPHLKRALKKIIGR